MSRERILIAEDDDIARENLEHILVREGYEVTAVKLGASAVGEMKDGAFDLAITDLRLPDVDGMEILKSAKTLHPGMEVLVVTGFATVSSAVEAMRKGAYHYLAKPFKVEELRLLVQRALEKSRLQSEVALLRQQLSGKELPLMVGQSPGMLELKKTIAQVAAVDSNVLVYGETGTGKELVAKSIHALSPRREKRFLGVNCASFSEELLANELFGHEQGAFTGARAAKKGLMEAADGGTFFMDEIGDMSMTMQVKLLRVLEERTLIRVGGTEEVPVDVRILAATNKDLKKEVEQGGFRRDLFYRLNVINLYVPSLAERSSDVPLLASFFLTKYARLMNKNVTEISSDAMKILVEYAYPGNVRELENIIERAVALCTGSSVEPGHLPPDLTMQMVRISRPGAQELVPLRENEKRYILWVLDKMGGNRSKAADLLGIDRASLWRKLKRYGVEEE